MKKNLLLLLFALFLLGLPYLFNNDYLTHILVMCGIHIILVLSLNLISGFAGQVSMGHAAFFGIGAYTAGLLAVEGVPMWGAMFLAAPVAAVFGFLIGYPVLRLKGHFFAIATLGFGEIIHLVLNNWIDVTRGPMGLSGIPKPEAIFGIDFSSKTHYYYLLLAMITLVVYLSLRMKNSKTGRALMAIRTDEITARAMGINVTYYKNFAFAWSAAVAGLAGAAYASFILFLSPETFTTSMSINILSMLLIGGIGSIMGAVLGGLFITSMTEYLRAFAEYQMLLYGLLMILVVIFAPKGLNGLVEKGIALLRRGGKTHGTTHSAD
jgi:branched-chain amino acid transport system permease protein